MAPQSKICAQCASNFVIEEADFAFYDRLSVPPPTLCSQCRLKRRFMWRNERTLFRRKDSATGNMIFSGFPEGVPFPVYERDYWWSDAWDAMDYGRDFDPSRPFLEQLKELMDVVPWASRAVFKVVNCDYTDQSGSLKNCYLCFNDDRCEDSCYLIRSTNSREAYDSIHVDNSEVIYDSLLMEKSFRTFYSIDCESCTDVYFSNDCVGCTNCFGCVGLRKKSYYIWNQPYSKEEYFEKIKSFNLGSRTSVIALKKQSVDFFNKFPARYYHGIRNIGSTGDMLYDTKNVKDSYWVIQAQDVRYSQGVTFSTTDSYDLTIWGFGANRVYDSVTVGDQVSDIKFCFDCWPSCKNLEYCMECRSTSDCFGCIGLKKKQYCILNKQYSKQEYELLRAEIIQQMNDAPYVSKNAVTKTEIPHRYGEFFPVEFSPFAYNETILLDTFPLTKEEATAQGYPWRETSITEYKATIKGSDLPDNINDVTDDVFKEIIACETCPRAFRITPMELMFYRKLGIPVPSRCPECRHGDRFKLLNPPEFNESPCQCAGATDEKSVYKNIAQHFHGPAHCPSTFSTAYPRGYQRSLYCEQCYQAEIV